MTFLEKICSAFHLAKLRYAVVGGHAVALHGAVRGTVDIDFVFEWRLDTLKRAEAILNGLGLISSLPISANDIYQFRQEYIENRNLIAWNFYNPTDLSQQVDIIINYALKANMTTTMQVGVVPVQVLNKKALIKMKQNSGREQDLEDVAALERL